MSGLIHIYCGDGKGKTTASVGLAVRAAGSGKKVLFSQFFKNGDSGEISCLNQLKNIELMHCGSRHGLFFRMNDAEKEAARKDYTDLLHRVLEKANSVDLLILDEVISACNYGAVPQTELADFLRHKPDGLEVVMTGRKPAPELQELADYITEMKKIKHPFDSGIPARKGIEF